MGTACEVCRNIGYEETYAWQMKEVSTTIGVQGVDVDESTLTEIEKCHDFVLLRGVEV